MTRDSSSANDNPQNLLDQLQMLKQHQQDAVEFQQKFEILHAISIQLDRTPSFDELCRLGVELGLEHLDVDRMSFWFVDEKREFLTGTFGVDEQGNLRDERSQRKRFEDEVLRSLSFGDIEKYRDEDAPLYNEYGEVVGHGWVVVVPLLNDNEIVGYLACDNLINQRPLKSYQPKLLQMYGSTIGFLARNKQELSRRQMFQYAIEQSRGSICFFSLDGEIIHRNSSMLRLFENQEFQYIEELIDYLNTRDRTVKEHVVDWQSMAAEAQLYHEWELELADGSEVFLEMRISTIIEHSKIVQYFLRFDDVTMRRKAEQQTLQLQLEYERAELLQTFVTHTAHEFRTPLSVINTKAYLVSRYVDTEKVKDFTNEIQEQSTSIQSLLDDMLEMVRLQSQTELNVVHTNLSRALSVCVTRAQQSDSGQMREWDIEIQSDLFVSCDEVWFSKATSNILENAIVYSSDDSTIAVQAFAKGDNLHINISDQGIGISEDKLQQIFEPLYRVDKARTLRGTGLGLAIAKLVIERCGGTIYATSQIDVGTTIHITLPISETSP